MPPPWHPLPANLKPVHLYRHLLRESTYLPPAIRPKIKAVICDRFHRHRKYDARKKEHLAKARSALRALRAANSGDNAAMKSLIFEALGRSGDRRQYIMAEFVRRQGPGDSESLQNLIDQAAKAADGEKSVSQVKDPSSPEALGEKTVQRKKASNHPWLDKWDQPKLVAFLKSQRKQEGITKGTTSWSGRAIKDVDPDILVPKSDVWGRSPPTEILTRAKQAKWWKLAASKMKVPLGRGEWDLLRSLADGAQDHGPWTVPDRRPRATSIAAMLESQPKPWDWKAHAQQQICVVERLKTRDNQRGSGELDTGPYSPLRRRVTLSSRWYRRMYNRTWQLTPTTMQDPNTLKYSFEWGRAPSKMPAPSELQLNVFAGVDAHGQKIKGR
ncbi:hypothetical protein HIM_00969 [Hirsutella minnesotensis 3608]|nr:hypothetical protein HIM_00969 [Hirsutella minnesotensis 3608]